MAALNERVGSADYNDIFAGTEPAPHVQAVKLAASQGVLERGSLLVGVPGEEFSIMSAAVQSGQTGLILAEDTDTGTDGAVTAPAYSSGFFRREAIKTKSYDVTDAEWDKLRGICIFTTDSVD